MTRGVRRRLGLTAVVTTLIAACSGGLEQPQMLDESEMAPDAGARPDVASASNDAASTSDVGPSTDASLATEDVSTPLPPPPPPNDGGNPPPPNDGGNPPPPNDGGNPPPPNDGGNPPPPNDGGNPPPPNDGGNPPPPNDGGNPPPPNDGGNPPPPNDGGNPPPPNDGGTPPPNDGGNPPPPNDGGTPPPNDGGPQPPNDGGVAPTDSGAPSDGGSTAGTPPTGSGQAEGELTGGSILEYGYGPGNHVAMNGDTIAIGSPGVNSRAGQVEVYRWSTATSAWALEQNLTPNDSAALANFGTSVAIDPSDSGRMIVGDIWGPTSSQGPTATTGAGEAFIFTRSGSTWTQAAVLSCPSTTSNAQFGYAVALSGKTAAVGWPRIYASPGYSATGMVTIFSQGLGPAGKWTRSVDIELTSFASHEYAGTALSLVGTNLIIGAPGDWSRSNGSSAGRVEVFTGSSATWTSLGSLAASDGAKWDQFGWSVAQSSSTSTIVVGAPSRAGSESDGGTLSQVGAAYVFAKSGNSWSEQAKLTPPTSVASAKFGYTVAAPADDKVVIGAPGTRQLFLYTRSGSTWSLAATYTACNSGAIGSSLAASGNLAVSASANAWVFDLADPDTSCVGP